MESQKASSPQFPVRLGRRLGLVQALILVAVLSAGGLALFSAARIYQINMLISREYDHALLVDAVHIAFHEILVAANEVERAADPIDVERLSGLQRSLDRKLQIVEERLGETRAATGEEREDRLIGELRRVAEGLDTLMAPFASSPTADKVGSLDVEGLERLAEKGARVATQLVDVHKDGVRQLLQVAQGQLRVIIALYVALLAVGIAAVLFIGRLGNRWIAAPLRRLAENAYLVGVGRLETRVAVASRDEIGQLSHAFNVMSESLAVRDRELQRAQERLRQKIGELELLNRIGAQMLGHIGINERDSILRSIAEAARTLLSFDASVICLAETDLDALTIHATSGADDAFQRKSGALSRSTPCDGGPGSTISDCPVWRPEYSRTHIALPLKRAGEVRGVLCVASRQERTLSADERELLDALAAQAAITVEQSRLNAEVQRLAVLEERGRIAREMHDGLAQTVSLLYLRIRETQAKIPPAQFALLGNALEEMAAISGDMYEEIRRSISGLRIPASQESGFVPALRDFLKEFSARTRLPVEFTAEGVETVRLSPASESQAIRIVQEALNNVRRHAQVDRARVLLECKDGCLRVSVQDEGLGFDSAQVSTPDGFHIGLRGMRERAEGLGGKLEIVTGPGQGTSVIVLLPLEKTS